MDDKLRKYLESRYGVVDSVNVAPGKNINRLFKNPESGPWEESPLTPQQHQQLMEIAGEALSRPKPPTVIEDKIRRSAPLRDIERRFVNPEETPRLQNDMLYRPKLDSQGRVIKEEPTPIPLDKPQYDEQGNEYIQTQNAIYRPNGDYSKDQRKMIINKTPKDSNEELMKTLEELFKDQGIKKPLGE